MEWPTVVVIAVAYSGWAVLTAVLPVLPFWTVPPVLLAAILTTTFHSSLQHECAHGHPTRSARLNEALVFLPLGVFFPYRRFKSLHLQHHRDETLTDPYDDPESWYLAESGWARVPRWFRPVFRANTTLAGRFVFGPLLSLMAFYCTEIGQLKRNAPGVRKAWALHGLGLVPVILWLTLAAGWSFPVYVFAVAYPAMGVLMIRTYAEHRAHENAPERTVIIEHKGLLSLIFLNNNLHFVHHRHPRAPWYDLPRLYRLDAARYRRENGGYVFRGYGELARRFLFSGKEPVAHPLMRRG